MSLFRQDSTASLKQLASALSKQYKVSIKFHRGGESTHTNTATREVSVDLDTAFAYGEDYTVGLILHEVAHIRHSPDHIPIVEPSHKTASQQVYNMVEDRRIDALMTREYGGAEQFQYALSKPHLDIAEKQLKKAVYGVENKEQFMLTLGRAILEVEGYDTRYLWEGNGNIAGIVKAYKDINANSTHKQVEEATKTIMSLLEYIPPDEPQGGHEHLHLGQGGLGSGGEPTHNFTPYAALDAEALEQVGGLKKKLILKLRDTEHQKFIGDQKRGSLDKKRLVRVAHKNYRVYRKRIEQKGKKYTFGVVLDVSGSMRGGRESCAMISTAMILRAAKSLGFGTALTVFGNQAYKVLETKDPYHAEDIGNRIALGDYGGGSHGVHRGIKAGLEQLSTRSGKKVLVVITDGGLHLESIQAGKTLINEATKKGVSTIIYYVESDTLRILEDPAREKTINNPSQLVPATLELLKSIDI